MAGSLLIKLLVYMQKSEVHDEQADNFHFAHNSVVSFVHLIYDFIRKLRVYWCLSFVGSLQVHVAAVT